MYVSMIFGSNIKSEFRQDRNWGCTTKPVIVIKKFHKDDASRVCTSSVQKQR